MSVIPAADASPWSREKNEVLFISRFDYFRLNLGDVSVEGELVDARFERIETNNYVEYGLTDATTIGGKIFYGANWLTRGQDVEAANGFTEIEFFAQHQLYRTARHAVAFKLTTSIPPSLTSDIRQDLQGGGVDIEVSALYGQSILFHPIRLFAGVEIGYRKRLGASADQLRLLTTVGVEPDPCCLLLLETYSVRSLKNETEGGANFDIYKFRPSVNWRMTPRWSIQAGIEEEFAGRNITLGRTYFLGLWTRF